jgi:purine-binding chemotaxis protein CheW
MAGMAQAAAAVSIEGDRAGDAPQYLAFSLGAETFAVRILVIKEIIEHRPLTRVPMMPPWISGVINLRGAAVPVIELSARLGRIPAEVTKRTCIVIVDVTVGDRQQNVGLVVDTVKAVLEIPPGEVEPVPQFGTRIDADLMGGVGKVDGKFIILLDVDHLVAAEDLDAVAAAEAF